MTNHPDFLLAPAPGKSEVSTTIGIKLNVPEWFQDEEFVQWLNNPETTVATWHPRGETPSEWSDIFLTIEPNCEGEGVSCGIPPKFWLQIVEAAREHIGVHKADQHYWVRLTNE